MPRNVEIKARVESLAALARDVAALADEGPFELEQDDTFFACADARLKLRVLAKDRGELIVYRRANEAGPKTSSYTRAPTADPDALRECLAQAYGVVGRVQKHRTLYLIGRTRVHLDRVRDLGEFVELEVVLADDEPADAGMREAHVLMARLGVQGSQLVEGSYVDLIDAGR